MSFATAEAQAVELIKKSDSSTAQLKTTEKAVSMIPPVNQVLKLQKSIGNRAVQKLIDSGFVRTRLKVNHPKDKFEQEAESIADEIVQPLKLKRVDEESVQFETIAKIGAPSLQKQPKGGGEEPQEQKVTPTTDLPEEKTGQRTEQYETKGITFERTKIEELKGLSYWEQRIMATHELVVDNSLGNDVEKRDSVLSVLWQAMPKGSISNEITRIVSIPKRGKIEGSKNIVCKFTFRPKKQPKKRDTVEVTIVSEDTPVAAIISSSPPKDFSPKQPDQYSHSGFPGGDIDKYWKTNPEEHIRLFNWIQNVAGSTFNNVVPISVITIKGKKQEKKEVSFHVKGTKDPTGSITGLTITFLGSSLPIVDKPPSDYTDKDFADLKLEEAQTKKNPKKQDKLGTISKIDGLPADEQLSVKYAIWQYFQSGTRNAEVDAIIPIANGMKEVLYTFRFRPNTNNVDVERIGEKEKVLSTKSSRLDIGRIKEFGEKSKDAATLKSWLAKRYPSVNFSGATTDEICKSANEQVRNNAISPEWFKNNYGIVILSSIEGSNRLKSKHKFQDARIVNTKNFNASELINFESTLETLADLVLTTLKGIHMIRQEASIEPVGNTLKQSRERTGLSLYDGNERSIIIFDAATAGDAAIFLGGKGKSGPAVHPYTSLTFSHELGHFVGWQQGVKSAFDAFVKKNNIKPLTWYAAKNPPEELFPEAFALYNLDPTWLRNNWPTLNSWFDTYMKTGIPPP